MTNRTMRKMSQQVLLKLALDLLKKKKNSLHRWLTIKHDEETYIQGFSSRGSLLDHVCGEIHTWSRFCWSTIRPQALQCPSVIIDGNIYKYVKSFSILFLFLECAQPSSQLPSKTIPPLREQFSSISEKLIWNYRETHCRLIVNKKS